MEEGRAVARRASLNASALAVDSLGAALEAKRQAKLRKSQRAPRSSSGGRGGGVSGGGGGGVVVVGGGGWWEEEEDDDEEQQQLRR